MVIFSTELLITSLVVVLVSGTGVIYLEMVLMSVAFMAMTLIIFILYGLAAHSVSRQLANAPKGLVWLQRSFAATFAALGVKLAMTDQ